MLFDLYKNLTQNCYRENIAHFSDTYIDMRGTLISPMPASLYNKKRV